MTKYSGNFLSLKKAMLPESLTASQENIPNITEDQLAKLSFPDNHHWKLNARMLGYEEGDVDDFIESLSSVKIKSYKKGKQVSMFCYDGTPALEFPIAIDGDYIVSQKYEMTNG